MTGRRARMEFAAFRESRSVRSGSIFAKVRRRSMIMLLAAAACGGSVPQGAVVTDSVGVRVVQHQTFDTSQPPIATTASTPSHQLGGSEAPPNEAIGYVLGRAIVLAEAAVVADVMSDNLRRIDLGSGAVSSVGRSGQGPAEYLYPSLVGALDGDSVVVCDGRLRRVTILDSTGMLARSFDVPSTVRPFVGAVGLLSDGAIVFAGGHGLSLEGRRRVVQDTMPVLVVGRDGELVSEFGRPAPILRQELDSIIDAEAEASGVPEGVRALFRLMPIPEDRPPFEQIVIDIAGDLWVLPNVASLTERAWFVFDARGDFIGHARLPPGRILYLGGGLVITLTYDSHDAQVVSVFTLRSDVIGLTRS